MLACALKQSDDFCCIDQESSSFLLMVEPWRKEEEKKNRDGRIDWVWKGKGEKEKESAISRVVLENIGEIVDYDKVGEGSQQVNIREESEKILLFFQILDFDSFQSIEF